MAPIGLTKDLERKARVLALVGDLTRIRVLRLLAKNGRVNVTDIAKEVNMAVACISHHLQLLRDNKILQSERAGNSIYYRLADDPLVKALVPLIRK